MHKQVEIEEVIKMKNAPIIDVRSPKEFAEACIPGAYNIPLLRDEEREIVGTLYKQQGPEQAKQEALKLVSPRLPDIVKRCQSLTGNGPIVLYCWRGGMRSKAVSTVLDMMGIPNVRLLGGYKAYRRHVNRFFEQELTHKVIVLHGLTGVGKTEVIEELQNLGAAAVDLEGLANNRGSVFGGIGMAIQPSQKMFEGLLADQLIKCEKPGYVIVEGESRRIGRLILPEVLYSAMKNGTSVLLYCPLELRIERIKRIYTRGLEGNNLEPLIEPVLSLGNRLGKARVKEICQMITENSLDEAVRILLMEYYDPLYKYPDHPKGDYDYFVDSSNPREAALKIMELIG